MKKKKKLLKDFVPSDFSTLGTTHSSRYLAELYNVSVSTVQMWRRMTGVKCNQNSNRLKMPDNFPDVAPGVDATSLSEMYFVSKKLIYRWKRECGIFNDVKSGRKSKMTLEFLDDMKTGRLSSKALAQKYGVTEASIKSWEKISRSHGSTNGCLAGERCEDDKV